MMVSRDLKSYNPNLVISMLSMIIVPSTGSIILNKANVNDDLPAPVLPTAKEIN